MNGTPTSGVTPINARIKSGLTAHSLRLARVLRTGSDRNVGTITINAGGGVCATDGKNVVMDYPVLKSARNDAENLAAHEAVLAHEVAGHLRYTNFNAWKRVSDGIKRGDEDRLLHDLVNIVEDRRVNHLLSQDFPGSKKRLDWTQTRVMAMHVAHVAENPPTSKDAPRYAVIALATEVIVGERHVIHVPEVIDFMNDVRPLIPDAIAQKDTSGVIKAARGLLEVFRRHFPADSTDGKEYGAPNDAAADGMFADDMSEDRINEAANNQRREQAKAEDADIKRFREVKVPKGDGVGENPAGGVSKGDEDGEGASGAGDDGEGEEGTSSGSETGEGDSQDTDTGAGEGDGEGGSDGGSGDGDAADGDGDDADGGDGEGGDGYGYTPTDELVLGGDGEGVNNIPCSDLPANLLKEMQDSFAYIEADEVPEVSDLPEHDPYANTMGGDAGAGYANGHRHIVEVLKENDGDNASRRFDQVVAQNRAGIKRLVTTLQNFTKGRDERFSSHKKRGGLDTSRLWASGTSDRVFRKRVEKDVPKVAASILIDASGSMSGRRARQAADAAAVLSQALEDFGATYEVVDFNSDYHGGRDGGSTLFRVRKGAREMLKAKKANIATAFAGSQNSDGHAVRWAINRTAAMAERGSHRLVFVISDGSPSGPAPGGNAGQHLHAVLKEAATEDVTIFSVGMGGYDTSPYYAPHGHGSCAVNGSDLAAAIIMPLKVALKKALKGVRA